MTAFFTHYSPRTIENSEDGHFLLAVRPDNLADDAVPPLPLDVRQAALGKLTPRLETPPQPARMSSFASNYRPSACSFQTNSTLGRTTIESSDFFVQICWKKTKTKNYMCAARLGWLVEGNSFREFLFFQVFVATNLTLETY